MTGNVVGEPIEDFVDSQIRTRQSNQFSGYGTSLRTDDQLKYLSNRNAWIKLASSISVLPDSRVPTTPEGFVAQRYGLEFTGTTIPLGESKLSKIGIRDTSNYLGTQLAEKAVLFNTISQYTGGILNNNRAGVTNANNLWSDSFIYGIGGTEFGIQPPPGIIGVTVDSINRGSIRKANITLKAHNKFQFDIIELLYLRLGFTMMLEWGWDKYLDSKGVLQQTGNTIIEDEWFKTNGTTQLQMLTSIQKKRRDYQGNYDGFFGKVSNFTWNFNPDGSYDISIDLITLGDIIESLKVNTSVKEKFYPDGGLFRDIKFPKEKSDTNIAKVATLNTLGYFLFNKIREITNNFTYKSDENINTNYPNYISFFTTNTNSYRSPQYYVRLGEFLTQLEGLIVPKVQNNNSDKFSQITFEKTGCLITYFPNQIPLDPRVCIFKPSLNSYGDIKGIVYPDYLNSLPIPYLVSIDGNIYGSLMDLYINFEFIAGLLTSNGGPDQELFLFKFLQDLCNGINTALGGVNKLEPVIKEDYFITIIDQTLSSPEDKDTVSLEVYGYNPSNLDNDGNPSPVSNFVKDVKFVSKITPQLASMISIGATAAGSNTSEIDGTAFSKWSEGLVDRFAEKISEPAGLDLLTDNQEKGAKSVEDYKKIFEEFDYEDSFNTNFLYIRSFQLALARLGNSVNPGGTSTVVLQNLEKEEETKKRIVKNSPRYKDLENRAMTFSEFYAAASQIDINKKLQGIRDENEINELTSTNYAIYLIKAFGGISNEIKIEYQNYVETPGLRGIGTSKYYVNSTTVENLQVDINQSRYREFDEVFISQGKSAYKTYINALNNNRYKKDNIPSSEVGFIPLSFELILDGISGIKIYNKLKINNEFLPSNYPASLSFIITKVNHNISNNSWDTSLSTISIPRTEPYKYNVVPESPTNSGGENTVTGPIGPFPDNGSPFQLLDGRNSRQAILLDNLLKELDPKSRPIFRQFFDTLKSKYSGYKFIITSVGRSWEKSWNFKYDKNNPNYDPGNAAPGTSPHNYSLALDMVVETPQSTTKRTLGKKQGDLWKQEGIPQIAATISGLEWGGNYRGYDDSVHFGYRYSTTLLYNQIVQQSKILDPTITFPIKGDARGLADCKKIDKLISSGKIKLNIL